MNWNKFLGVAVIASVVVNLLLAGFIVGRLMPEHRFSGRGEIDRASVHRDAHAISMQRGHLNIGRGMRALSRASREDVREFMRDSSGEMREAIERVQIKRREIFELLTESPEDLAVIEENFSELSELTAAAQTKSQNFVLQIVQQLPIEERTAFLRGAASLRSESRRR